MNKAKKTYSLVNRLAAVLMIITLAWLTVSSPFIMSVKEQYGYDANAGADVPAGEEDNSGNPGSNTEEKAPNSTNNLSEEYLHQHHSGHNWFLLLTNKHKQLHITTYLAYHGELHVPPPNA